MRTKQITTLNNSAVYDLIQGKNTKKAYETLKSALYSARRKLAQTRNNNGNSQNKAGRDSNEESSSSSITACICHNTFKLATMSSSSSSSTLDGYLFDRLITINFDDLPEDDTKGSIDICIATIVFNLAILHHNQSLALSHKTKIVSDRAITLYNYAIRVLNNTNNSNNNENDDDNNNADGYCGGTVGLLRLAALNNLTQLRYAMGNYSMARAGIHHLSLMVASESTSEVVDDEVKRGLVMNVLSLSNQHVAPAA